MISIVPINKQLSQNFWKLNKEKTKFILFGSKEERLWDAAYLKDKALKTKVHIKNLVILDDSDLSFNKHVKGITKSVFIHLKIIAKVRDHMKKTRPRQIYSCLYLKMYY